MVPWIVLIVVVGIAIFIAATAFQTVRVSRWETGALYIDDGLDRMLPPGQHKVLRLGRRVHVYRISLAQTYLPVGPVDALTADRLPIRLNATVLYRITDAEASLQTPPQPQVQLAASQAMIRFAAGHTLEALLEGAALEAGDLAAEATGRLQNVAIDDVALAAIVLPPELRRMTTEVERAKQEGLAALERARGEHAALRTLANAARMLKDNPELMNLRLVQALGAGGKGATLVLGESALKVGAGRD